MSKIITFNQSDKKLLPSSMAHQSSLYVAYPMSIKGGLVQMGKDYQIKILFGPFKVSKFWEVSTGRNTGLSIMMFNNSYLLVGLLAFFYAYWLLLHCDHIVVTYIMPAREITQILTLTRVVSQTDLYTTHKVVSKIVRMEIAINTFRQNNSRSGNQNYSTK